MSRGPRATAAADAVPATAPDRCGRVALLLAGACAVAVVLSLPLLRRAVSEFGLPLQYQGIIRQQAAAKQLDPALIAAVIYAETKFDARTSPAGAEGLMQIEPQTAEFLAHLSGGSAFTVSDLWKPSVNIAYGSYYLRYLLTSTTAANCSRWPPTTQGRRTSIGWLTRARAQHRRFVVDTIPFPETRAYVQKVLAAQKDYRHTYATQLGYR